MKKKKTNIPPLTKEYIEQVKSQEKTWKDLGFDDFMVRKSVARESKASSYLGMKREQHDLKMALLANKIDIDRKLKSTTRTYWYENYQLNFTLETGSTDQFDFSKANRSRKIFEAFWYLWVGSGKSEYYPKEVREKYKQLHKEQLGEIGVTVSNIRASIINPKTAIRDKIIWEFNRQKQKWIFKIS